MIFSSYGFIFIFLPVVFIGYFLFNRIHYRDLAKLWLVLASFVFYAIGSPSFFPFFLASIVGNYIIGNILSTLSLEAGHTDLPARHSAQGKVVFAIGILANVALLGYYKYTDFFIVNINFVAHTDIALRRIILPIGISFFTFQLIAFLVDSYRGLTAKSYSILDYLLFITFFPQLIVGPITHHSEMVPQFEDESKDRLNWDNVAAGLFLFSIGCAKKILLADPLTIQAQTFFNAVPLSPGFAESWYYAIEYTISYYFDLSGYADMAIGLGKMFNINIPHNFNSPYKARNFQDYWQRWHITLSRFLGDYIFRSVYRKGSRFRDYYIATMVTFFVSGFWHGAGWTFVAWGLINGLFVCAASWMKWKNLRFPFLIAFCLTALGVVALRVLFVAETFTDAWRVCGGMVNFASLLRDGASLSGIVGLGMTNKITAVILALSLPLCWFLPNSQVIAGRFKASWFSILFSALLIGLSLFRMNNGAAFLYFQF
jgi:D-alanyl-lipoteichoic acid acyltransferase DltB (MBOAT superfamily)